MKAHRLSLYEEVTLLALRDKQGTVSSGVMYGQAVAGAVLAELLLAGRIVVDDTPKRLVTPVGSRRIGDPLIDECLERIRAAKRRGSLQTWVSRFAGIRHLKRRVAERLCRRGILRVDEKSVLLVFSRTIYPEVNPEPERRLVERLRKAVFTEARDLEPRTVVLVSLADATGLLKATFDKKRVKSRKARIRRIVAGEVTGRATRDAVAAAQAAAMMAAIMPAIIMPAIHGGH